MFCPMIDKRNPFDIPNYGMVEASRYFHIPPQTVSYWAHESRYIKLASPQALSFNNLTEFYVIRGLREIHKIRPSRIKSALRYLRSQGSTHPFAEYDIVTDGAYVLFYHDGRQLVNASLQGQAEMEVVIATYLKRIDREGGQVKRLFPYTKREDMLAEADPPRRVVIDPRIRSGLPVLVGSRITTASLAGRYRGGDLIPSIAKSYGRSEEEVKEAIEWELGTRIKEAA
jgi:uncharacterized protein (DUF433 family)